MIDSQKSPARMLAGRLNRQKRRALTDDTIEHLRQSALRHQPWLRSTGPLTEEGKRRCAQNGRSHKPDPNSRRQIRAGVRQVYAAIASMAKQRQQVIGRELETGS